MDGNPEGTPNPLNPVQGAASAAGGSQPGTDMATGTGLSSGYATGGYNGGTARPASFAQPNTQPTSISGTVSGATASSAAKPSVDSSADSLSSSFDSPSNYAAPSPAASATNTASSGMSSTSAGMSEAPRPVPTTSAMPEMRTASGSKPSTSYTSHGVIDPMMRPVSHNSGTHAAEPTRAESNFDTFGMDDDTLDQLGRGLEQTSADSTDLVAKDSIVEPAGGKGSKKKPLIIGAVILIVIAVACGVAALVIMMMNNKGDRVGKAIDKLMNGEVSSIVQAAGTVSSTNETSNTYTDFYTDCGTSGGDLDCSSSIASTPMLATSTVISFDATVDMATSINKVEATITTGYGDGSKATVDLDELRNKGGDTFFKVSGLSSLLNVYAAGGATQSDGEEILLYGEDDGDSTEVEVLTTNCLNGVDSDNCGGSTTADSESDLMTGMMSVYSSLLDAIDNQWILVSGDFSETMEGLTMFDNSSVCLINALATLPTYSKDLANKYKANPFVTYSTDNLEITKKKNELYKLGFDNTKLTAFVNSLGNNGFINELNACAGNRATNTQVATSLVEEIFSNFPTVYVEVDDNDNFTRVYFTTNMEVDDGVSTAVKADISLSYPAELRVSDPSDYVEMSTLLSSVMSTMLKSGETPLLEEATE